MSAHPGVTELQECTCRVWETQPQVLYISEVKKLCVILHQRLLQGSFAWTDIANAVYTVSYTLLMVTWCRSECCVLSGIGFEAAGGSFVVFMV